MKVLIITSGFLPIPAYKGGAIETLIDGLVDLNEKNKILEFEILSIDCQERKKETSKKKHTKYTYISTSKVLGLLIKVINKLCRKEVIEKNILFMNKAIKYANRNEHDYIIMENYPEKILKINSKNVIEYVHSDVFNTNTKNCKEILSRCKKVITVSNFIKERVCEIDQNQKEKVIKILNYNTTKKISKYEYYNNRKLYRKKYGIKENQIVYSYLGRISPEKGTYELVKAFTELDLEQCILLIIGGSWYGSKKKTKYLKLVESIANKKVIFTGYVQHDEIYKLLCASDVGVVPSVCNEAAGLSVIEFMNSGNLVIGSNRGGISEYMSDKFGYVIDVEKDLKRAIKQANKDVKNRLDFTKYNMKFSNNFSIEKYYKELIKVLEE